MFRHPAGPLLLILVMLLLATGLGGAITGEWGLEHVRGRLIMPGLITALILLAIAGPRRGVVAVIGEGAAVLSVLLALNYARLVIKWSGDGRAVDQAFSAGLGLGFLVAAVLLVRSRPAAEDGDWHRGSALLGGTLWFVGLRPGPGSRAGLGLTVLALSAMLGIGMFEKVQRAEAIGRSAYLKWLAPSSAGPPKAVERRSSPATGPSAWGTGPADVSERGDQQQNAATSKDAHDERPADARAPGWGGGAPKASEGSPATDARRGWINPVPERRLALPATSPRVREAATPVRTRIAPGTGGRAGPWSGVLTDRPLDRARRGEWPRLASSNADRGRSDQTRDIAPPIPSHESVRGPMPTPLQTAPLAASSESEWPGADPSGGSLAGPVELLTMGPWPPVAGRSADVAATMATAMPASTSVPRPIATADASPAPRRDLDAEPATPPADALAEITPPEAPSVPVAVIEPLGSTTRPAAAPPSPRVARPTAASSARPTAWADPSFAIAADAGAMQAGTFSLPPFVLYGAGGLLLGLVAVGHVAAARRNGAHDVTATTGSP